MTKNELVSKISNDIDVQRGLVMSVINCVFDNIYTTVKGGETVHAGAFVFKPHIRAARKGRHPNTGEIIDLPESKSIVCRVRLK